MKSVLTIAMLVGAAQAADSKATPVQKVIELMQGMLDKGKKEKHEEAVQFAAYKSFCDNVTPEKQKAIADANQKIEDLKADIFQYTTDAQALAEEIAVHDKDIAVWTGDLKAATNVRAIEKADYDALHKDLSESVDALGRAIAILKKQAYDRAQAASLVQIAALKNLNLIPPEAKRAIDVFLAQRRDQDDETPALLQESVSAPEANAYEFQSQGIVDMLQKLLDEFIAERTAAEKEESDSLHAFSMLEQDLNNNIAQSTAARDEKAALKAKKLQAKADAEGDLQDTTTTRDDDVKFLEDLVATCEQKAADFESRQNLRQEEIEAITKAIEIISSGSVAGKSEKHLPQLVQTAQTSLSQLRADGISPTQKRVADYLREKSNQINSRLLSALAVRVESDPFKKIKKLIKDLITKLLEEANEEATHKGWCDTELATNKQTRNEKTEMVVTLHAEIDELSASIAKLGEEITELMQAVAEIDAAVAKATGIREAEKAKNTETIADSQEAQTAVAQALTVLREFYEKAAKATALVQQQPEAPEIFDKPYQGQGDSAGGVVGMLEVIQSDFARLEAETKAAENAAQKEYDQFMLDSEVDKTQKTQDIEHKTKAKEDQTQSMTEKKSDLEGTQKELDAALDYFEKLKPSCVDTGISYEDRVARREEEIQSLKEALEILQPK